MLRKVLAYCVMVCCLGIFIGCERPKGSSEPEGKAAAKADAGKGANKGAKKAAKDKVRKKKPPHVTTAK